MFISSANAVSDGDKESECDEDGPSPEDSRKVRKEKVKKLNEDLFTKLDLY